MDTSGLVPTFSCSTELPARLGLYPAHLIEEFFWLGVWVDGGFSRLGGYLRVASGSLSWLGDDVSGLMEKIMLPTLNEYLIPTYHQQWTNQQRTKPGTTLLVIQDQIQRGLDQKKPNRSTIMVDMDLSKAFDTVSYYKPLH